MSGIDWSSWQVFIAMVAGVVTTFAGFYNVLPAQIARFRLNTEVSENL